MKAEARSALWPSFARPLTQQEIHEMRKAEKKRLRKKARIENKKENA